MSPPSLSASQLATLLDISRSLAATSDLGVILRRLATAATSLLAAERASIFLHDPARDELYTSVALESAEIRFPAGLGIAGECFRSNAILHVPDAYADPRFNPAPDKATGFRTRDLLAVPMIDIDGNPVGVIEAINSTHPPFTPLNHAMLQVLADHAGVAVQRARLMAAALEREALAREMSLAQRVQTRLLPTIPPAIPSLSVAGWSRPALQVGGDTYDWWTLPNHGGLAVLLADASGHGLAPALVVSQVRALVRALSDSEPDPTAILRRVNSRLHADIESGRFCTAFLAFIRPDFTIQYSSAGQMPIILRPDSSTQILCYEPLMPPLGVLPDVSDYPPANPLTLTPGTALVATSDGITEAFDPNGEWFGLDNLLDLLKACPNNHPQTLVNAIQNQITAWQARPDPADDQTVLVVRRD